MIDFNIPSSASVMTPMQLNAVKFVCNHTVVTPKVLASESSDSQEKVVSLQSNKNESQK